MFFVIDKIHQVSLILKKIFFFDDNRSLNQNSFSLSKIRRFYIYLTVIATHPQRAKKNTDRGQLVQHYSNIVNYLEITIIFSSFFFFFCNNNRLRNQNSTKNTTGLNN